MWKRSLGGGQTGKEKQSDQFLAAPVLFGNTLVHVRFDKHPLGIYQTGTAWKQSGRCSPILHFQIKTSSATPSSLPAAPVLRGVVVHVAHRFSLTRGHQEVLNQR